MQDFILNLLANLVWVALVFGWFFVRDRRRREQERRCMEAYLTWLVRSASFVRNTVYPYVHLVANRTTEGTILPTLLDRLGQSLADIVSHLQDVLELTESPAHHTVVLRMYQRVVEFQAHVSDSRVAADVIVGNPVELVEERGEEEMRVCREFARDYPGLVRDVLQAVPEPVRSAIPPAFMGALDETTELQKQYES